MPDQHYNYVLFFYRANLQDVDIPRKLQKTYLDLRALRTRVLYPPMRTLVVFGRGGPRGPPRSPRYLSLPPPKLPFSASSILSGNRFQILASVPEQCEFEPELNTCDNFNFSYEEKSVVRTKRIPDSQAGQHPPKYQNQPLLNAPEKSSMKSSNEYITVVRGRKKSKFFNTKVQPSKQFMKKLKESVLPSSITKLPESEMNTSDLSPNPPEPNAHEHNFQHDDSSTTDDLSMEVETNPNVTNPDVHSQTDDVDMPVDSSTPNQEGFALTPEAQDALLENAFKMSRKEKSSLQKSLSANTVQPNIRRFFTSTKTTNIPSVPTVEQDSAMNVNTFTNAKTIHTNQDAPNMKIPPTLLEQNLEVSRIPVQTTSKKEITCRFKIRIEGGTCNLPLLVKQVVKLYRGVDSSLSVLPIESPYEDEYILDNEELIPETEDALKKWVTYVISHHERVHFTMRFSIMKSLSSISGPIFAWMKLNRSYVKMDTIKSEKIVTLGFFEGFHPDFQSRDKFKSFCLNHIQEKHPDLQSNFKLDDFSVYPRSVYVGSTMDKVTTRAMVVEVSVDHSSQVLSSLSSSFSGMYGNVTFVPFTKMDDDYQVLLKMAMLKQNKFLHSLKRKQIKGLVNPHVNLTKKDGQEITLCQWLQSVRDETNMNTPMIQSVEETRYSSSSILYYAHCSESIHTLCKDLKKNMEEHFPQSAIDVVFKDTYSPLPTTLSKIITDEEATWASILKRKYLPNPQEDIITSKDSPAVPPSKFRKSVYYGSTKTPSHLREDTHINVNPVSLDSSSVGSLTSDLSMKYQELEKQVQSILQSQEQAQNDTKTYVDSSIATMEENLNAQLQQNTDSIQKQITTLESASFSQFSVLTQTLNSVAGNVHLLLTNFNLNNSSTSSLPTSTTTTANSLAVGSGKH